MSPRPKRKAAASRSKGKKAPVRTSDQTREFEQLLLRHSARNQKYILRLYIAGTTPRSMRAVGNIRALCHEHLGGRCHLQVIDIYQLPEQTSEGGIIAAPTLVKELPRPVRRLIGDFSNRGRVLAGLDLADAPGGGRTDWVQL